MLPLLAVTVLVAAAVSCTRPMVSYRALALGAAPAELGLIASSFAAIALLVAVPLGSPIDRMGERRLMRVGIALVVVAIGSIPLLHDVPSLAISQAVLGVGQVTVVVSAQTLMANRGPDDGRARRFGFYTSMAALGHAD